MAIDGCCVCTDAPLMAFHHNVMKNIKFDYRPPMVTHTNDISIHFRTSEDQGVIFGTTNSANNDYIKAYLEGGRVHVDVFIERSGREVRYVTFGLYFG